MAETNLPALMAMAAQRRAEAKREMEAWEDFIRRLGMLGGPAGPYRPSISDLVQRQPTPRQPTGGRQKKIEPAVAETVEATKTFLVALGRPAGISEIYDEMMRRNVPVGGVKPKRTLDARLRYSGAFKGVAGKGWWLGDRPLPGQADTAATGNPAERTSESAFRDGEPG